MTALTEIEPTGRDRRACVLRFDDGQEHRTSCAVVQALGLEPGPVDDYDALMSALAEQQLTQSRERALRLLAYRERSRKELEERLAAEGYAATPIRATLDSLEQAGLLDDTRFAEAWARSRVCAGRGPRRISRELADRGIAPDVTQRALAEAFLESDEVSQAVRLIGPQAIDSRRERDRVLRRLLARGFSPAAALEAIERASDAHPDDSGGGVPVDRHADL